MISPLEGEMTGRPEGVAAREALASFVCDRRSCQDVPTPSVAFGDISPSRAGLSHMSDCLDEIVVIPSAFLDAVADGDFVDVGGLKDISGDAVNERGVGWGVVLAGTAEVFMQMNVEHPMQSVLDLPMSSGEVDGLLR